MSTETIIDIADRVDRAGDRYRNAQDFERESQSRIAATAIRAASDLNQAREIALAFGQGSNFEQGGQNRRLLMASPPPRRRWWKWWRSSRTDDSSDDS